MNSYIRIALLSLASLFSIYFYYYIYAFHNSPKGGMLVYLILIGVIYGGYKLFQNIGELKKVSFSLLTLIAIFLAQLLLVCFFFFGSNNLSPFLGIILFFKLVFFLALISLLWLIIYSLGKTILTRIGYLGDDDEQSFSVLSSLGVGFFVFMLGVFILGVFGKYTVLPICTWIILSGGIGFKTSVKVISSLRHKNISYRMDENTSYMRLVLDELHYILITLLLSVNFISVFRPFPIGWDDLGVYMNFPKLFAEAGGLIPLGQMQTWTLYTGIGHIFGNQTFAFLLNSFSGVIVSIVVYFALSGFIKKYQENTFCNLALLSVVVILMMPMAVFQLAKDMKLDYALLSMSLIPFYMMYSLFLHKESFKGKKKYTTFFIIGILIGFTFSIKVTSLLLFLGILGLVFYRYLSLLGFFGFFGIFVSIFSFLGLWSMMNITFPQDNTNFVSVFSAISFLLGIGFLGFASIYKHNPLTRFVGLGQELLLLILGFAVALLPWSVYHYSVAPEKGIGMHTILGSGLGERGPDYKSLYSEVEIQEKQNAVVKTAESGTTTNEDFGRYFGYEKGINNYLKLPWNLTFQVNQAGEFTEISYIFLVLFPVLLLFLPYRKEKYMYIAAGFITLTYLYYLPTPLSTLLSNYFSRISVPVGYLPLFLLAFAPLVFFYSTLDRTQKLTRLFLVNYVFLTLYGFLWAISAFGVVWYAIVMYIAFLISIALCLISADIYHKKISIPTFVISLATIWIYILVSTLPQSINNIKSAGYAEYKIGAQTQEESLMSFHPDYITILFSLNIDPEKQKELFIKYRNTFLSIIDSIPESESLSDVVRSIDHIGKLTRTIAQVQNLEIGAQQEKDLIDLRQDMFEDILHPTPETRNTHSIYRIGTFIKYFISENNKRLLEDSLLTVFQDYFYDENPDVIIERMKKLDISYLLVDLNAATIDQDPGKRLTSRYEDLLFFMTDPGLELIETDSICLKVALEGYQNDNDKEKYLNIAGLNHEPNKNLKRQTCIVEILRLIEQKQISAESYSYLSGLENKIMEVYDPENTGEFYIRYVNTFLSNGYKAVFEIK